MADYLVLEEDGTSRLELEENTDDFLLEESSPQQASVSLEIAVGITATPERVASPPSYAEWEVGTITVPSGTGSMAVTGLGRTPDAVFFFGTNWTTEDTAQTGNGLGLFRGMCAPQWDDPGMLSQQAACVISTPSGNAHSTQNNAIRMLDTAGGATALYVADVTSFDSDGFTLNWTTAAAGGYKVVYVALLHVANVGGRVGRFDGTTLDLGFKAGSSLLHGAWVAPIDGTTRTQEFYGGAAYPGTGDSNWIAAGATVFCFPTSSSAQYFNALSVLAPHIRVATGGHFISAFLATSNIKAYPTGSPSAGNNFIMSGDPADGGMVVVWDDEDSRCFFQSPAQANAATSTKTGLPFAPGLLIGYTISDEPTGQGTGGRGAIGFGVVTDDFQWCATVDGKSNQGAFQSFQRGIADVVNGTDVHAATVELTSDGFVMTTQEDAATSNTVAWHAFGHPRQIAVWIPQSYRRN